VYHAVDDLRSGSMVILVFVELPYKVLLDSEGSYRRQSIERRFQMREDGTFSWKSK
jgi:hypothetical protein